MNRRKFFRAAASFVVGCALAVGFTRKIESLPSKAIPAAGYHSFAYEVLFRPRINSMAQFIFSVKLDLNDDMSDKEKSVLNGAFRELERL